jgi:pyruvate-ferredoxin/flavodoxin oxidoreductase
MHSTFTEPLRIWASIPAAARAAIVARDINVVALDTLGLAERFAPTPELARRMQGATLVGVFLRVAPLVAERAISVDELMNAVRGPLERSVGKRGGAVVDANLGLIRAAYEELIDVTGAVRGLDAVEPRAEPREEVAA